MYEGRVTYAARELRYRAGGRLLLDGASLSLEPGQVHALLGPNGAGKTTLLRLLAGEQRPESGSIELNSRAITSLGGSVLARQRAVLILRDVLQWRAAEVADLLGTTPTAVNGLLIRARARMDQAGLAQDEIREPAAPGQRALLDQYVAAFENADAAALSQLLTQDAVFEMPPMLTWFTGRDRIVQFLGARVLGRRPGDFKLLPVAANGQPGFAG